MVGHSISTGLCEVSDPALAVLEELYGPFVLLGRCTRLEGAEIAPASGSRIPFS
jgi:hypothetical protein